MHNCVKIYRYLSNRLTSHPVLLRPLTMSDAETTVRKLIDEIAEKHQYENHDVQVKSFTTDGANYTSQLFFITISAPGKDDIKLFAKVACIGVSIREKGFADQQYYTEQQFYNYLMPTWKKLENKYDIHEEHRYVFPKFYAGIPTKGMETVVLEDMTASGYSACPRREPLTWEYAAKSAEVLAKFHAFSFIQRKENQEQFDKMTEQLKFVLPEDEVMKGFWTKLIQQPLDLLDEETREKLRTFLKEEEIRDKQIKYNSPRRHPILIHGDYRQSNLLHKEQDGELVIVAVDYQTLHIGCPVIDIIYFLFMGSDEAFRAKHWDRFLDHYYEQLSQQLRRYKMDPTEIYPREEFDEDMKEMLPYALIIGVTTLPVITVEAEHAPQISGDADMETFIVKPNELFTARFRGLVNDCLRWGVI